MCNVMELALKGIYVTKKKRNCCRIVEKSFKSQNILNFLNEALFNKSLNIYICTNHFYRSCSELASMTFI